MDTSLELSSRLPSSDFDQSFRFVSVLGLFGG
jgi:hypothetical protein